MDADLLIRGGTLVLERETLAADLAIQHEKIVAILAPGTPVQARRIYDATGLHVFPGLVDAHVHFNEPGRTEWEGFASGSSAAAAGGVTTVLDMPLNSHPPTLDREALALKQRAVAAQSVVDYGLWGGLVDDSVASLEGLFDEGVVGVKAFTCHSGLDEYPRVDDDVLLRGLRASAARGGLVALHAESHAITEAETGRLRARRPRAPAPVRPEACPESVEGPVEGRRDQPLSGPPLMVRQAHHERDRDGHHERDREAQHERGMAAAANGEGDTRAWARSRPAFAEEVAVRRTLRLAKRVPSARLHFVHLSTPSAIRAVASARAVGLDVSAETCPHYLSLDEDDFARLGPNAKCAPPLRPRAMVEELWDCLRAGTIDLIASDHSPCPPEAKRRGAASIWEAWGGIAGVQTMLPTLLTEGVHRRRLPLPTVARLLATNPARRFGLYPRKGALRVGSDADLALVDLQEEWTLTPDRLLNRWPETSPFLGRSFKGAVRATVLRGTVVFEAGAIAAQAGFGKLLTPTHA